MRFDVKNLWKSRKKWIIGITAGVAAAAIGCGVWYYAGHNSKEPVYVYPFQYIGMTEYWGDSQESYGPVTTDKIQTVFLSDTQTVTEILVQQGDMVKKGDLLMTFDTTLSDLQLERKRLEVEKLKLQQEDAREDLRNINNMKPMEIPEPSDDEDDSTVTGVVVGDEVFPRTDGSIFLEEKALYDGTSAEKAVILWIKNSTEINDVLLQKAESHAAYIRELNKPEPPEPQETEPQNTESQETEPLSTESQEADPTVIESPQVTPVNTDDSDTELSDTESQNDGQQPSSPSAVSEPVLENGTVFYVVIKTTANDDSLGSKKTWQCLRVTKNAEGYSFRFADTLIPDYSMKAYMTGNSEEEDEPEVDFGSGYTAAQIAQMRSDKQKEIKDLDFKIKMADAEYKIMLKEVSDGNVYADHDGEVVSLLTEEEAKQTLQPMLKVSGGGGFYVEGFVSELEKENMKPGLEVTVNDWNTGMTYSGTVKSIGDFPTQDGYYNGSGNPNASYYPFQVFVDESADLQAGAYVSVMYSTAESEHGIYLENPFLRTEKGRSYVLVLGNDGNLEQRWVRTGKSLWGNYTEILDGLTAEDLIAFPYGKNVKPGAPAQEGDMSNLYG